MVLRRGACVVTQHSQDYSDPKGNEIENMNVVTLNLEKRLLIATSIEAAFAFV